MRIMDYAHIDTRIAPKALLLDIIDTFIGTGSLLLGFYMVIAILYMLQ